MNTPLQPCSCCHQVPQLTKIITPFSVGCPKPAIKHQVACAGCALQNLHNQYAYFATFAWNTEAMAISDWNNAVENNNSWLTRKLQKDAREL
jgi:hypothetical protein